jgi:hypothetical protein
VVVVVVAGEGVIAQEPRAFLKQELVIAALLCSAKG